VKLLSRMQLHGEDVGTVVEVTDVVGVGGDHSCLAIPCGDGHGGVDHIRGAGYSTELAGGPGGMIVEQRSEVVEFCPFLQRVSDIAADVRGTAFGHGALALQPVKRAAFEVLPCPVAPISVGELLEGVSHEAGIRQPAGWASNPRGGDIEPVALDEAVGGPNVFGQLGCSDRFTPGVG